MHTSDVHGRKIKEEEKTNLFPSVLRWPHVLCMHRNSKMAVDSLLCFCSHRTVLYPPHYTILEVIYGPVFCLWYNRTLNILKIRLGSQDYSENVSLVSRVCWRVVSDFVAGSCFTSFPRALNVIFLYE